MGCPKALLGWSAELERRPITFAAYMALSPKDSAPLPSDPIPEEVLLDGLRRAA